MMKPENKDSSSTRMQEFITFELHLRRFATNSLNLNLSLNKYWENILKR